MKPWDGKCGRVTSSVKLRLTLLGASDISSAMTDIGSKQAQPFTRRRKNPLERSFQPLLTPDARNPRRGALWRMWLLAVLVFAGLSMPARAVAPAAPSNCVAVTYNRQATTATIDIQWDDNSTTETQWSIYYIIGGGSPVYLGTLPTSTGPGTGTTVSVSWSGAALNADYHFRVYASNGTETSAPSNVATVGTFDLNSPTPFLPLSEPHFSHSCAPTVKSNFLAIGRTFPPAGGTVLRARRGALLSWRRHGCWP